LQQELQALEIWEKELHGLKKVALELFHVHTRKEALFQKIQIEKRDKVNRMLTEVGNHKILI